jgi:O-antigen/teichoic acid export membrane protein
MTAADRLVRNSAFNLTGQGLYAVFHLVGIIALARVLGVTVFGEYYIVFSLTLVVQLLGEAGLGTILTRRLVRDPAEHRRIVAEAETLFVVVCVMSALILASIGVGFGWWRGDSTFMWAFGAAAVACAAMQIQRFCAGVLQGSEMFGYENIARVLQGAVFATLVLAVTVAAGARRLHEVVVLFMASHCVAAAFLVALLQRRREFARPSRHVPWRRWIGESGPLGMADVVRGLTWQLDTVLLGFLQPAAVVGIYSIAYRPLGPLNWLPRAVLAASFPSLTRLADTPEALELAFARSVRILTIVSVPITATIFLFAEPIVRLIAGADYLEAAVPLRVLIWVAVLSFLTMHFRFVMTAIGRQRAYAWLVGGVFAFEAAVELVLIPRLGYLGACAGTLAGEVAFAAAGLVLCRQSGLRGVQWRALARAALAGAAIVPLLWLARQGPVVTWVPLALAAVGIYFILCVQLGAIGRQEWRQFRGAVLRLLRPVVHPV